MTGLSYNRLFNVKVLHDFYVDGISRKDLAFAPIGNTALAMKNNNMLFRADDGGFRVLYKAEESGAPFIEFSNVRLTFAAQLINTTEFLNFTIMPAEYSTEKILYFTNIGSETVNALDFSVLDYLRPVMFSYTFPQLAGSSGDRGHLRITNQAGLDVTPPFPPNTDPDTLIPDTYLVLKYPVDLTGLPKGVYTFETWTHDSPSPEYKKIYVDNELAMQGAFAIVDILAITVDDFPNVVIPPDEYTRLYEMTFTRRLTQWKYIVVMKSASVVPGTSLITIVDDGTPDLIYDGPLFFATDPDDTLELNGFPIRIVTSVRADIPYYKLPKIGLTIKNDTVTVLTNIPGPPLGRVSADGTDFSISEIFVFI